MDDQDLITQRALFRYQVISGYLAADPPRGKRRLLQEQLAGKVWMLQSGEALSVKAETIRYWLRIYQRGGFEALKDKPRSDQGIRAIPRHFRRGRNAGCPAPPAQIPACATNAPGSCLG